MTTLSGPRVERPTLLAERLTVARMTKGWRLRDLAFIADIAETRVGDYERGKYVPTLSNLLRIADGLDVSVDWLCGRTDVMEVAIGVASEVRVADQVAGERDQSATHERAESPATSGPSCKTSGEVFIAAAHSTS